jgi:hypothetical protein
MAFLISTLAASALVAARKATPKNVPTAAKPYRDARMRRSP